MEPWNVIAILEMSAGNESVGEMWQETRSFDCNTTVADIVRWAAEKKNQYNNPEDFRGNLKLTIDQSCVKEDDVNI